jgi:hypothetical protein
MSTETDILGPVQSLGLFKRVNYLVAPADSDLVPTQLPIFVLEDGGADTGQFATFCGTDLVVHTYTATIIAETAAQVRDLTGQVSIALKGIAALDGVTESYDSELRAFIAELTLS